MIPKKFQDWQVYLYHPGDINSRVHCPRCNMFPRKIGGMFGPPFACEEDKIFFDECHDEALLKRSVNVAWVYKRGDLTGFFNKYSKLPALSDEPKKPG